MTVADASGRVEDLGFNEHDKVLPAYDYFDLSALFSVQRRFQLRIGVNNIFDKEPPVLTTNLGACWSGCNGNTYPQWYDPLGRFFFAGATVNLDRLHF
jgi:outer membrane receptor protein involved in Fe transport